MSLKERALEAEKAQREGYAISRHQEREKSLDKLIEEWPDKWRHRLDEPPPCPDRNEFGWDKVTSSSHRHEDLSGWLFEIDGVEFLYVAREGLQVVLTCPDCGERQGDSWYGIASLGEKLKKQRTLFHKCRQVAARDLAYAIRAAQEATGLPAYTIIEEALEIRSGWKT